MSSSIVLPPLPLQQIIPSYAYQQYSDDPDIIAFFQSLNLIGSSYLSWFNGAPLALYTSPNVSGPLLDWIAAGIYGLDRPVFFSVTSKLVAGLNAAPVNTQAIDGSKFFETNTAITASDDYFKRVLTWWFYLGNGRQFNVPLLRLKVARFLFGVDGTDVTLAQAQAVSIQPELLPAPAPPTLASVPGGSLAACIGGINSGPVNGWATNGSQRGHIRYDARISYVSALGETYASRRSFLSVSAGRLLVVDSPIPEAGAEAYNVYVGIVRGKLVIKGATNTGPLNGGALNGTGSFLQGTAETKQNVAPIPIGTNWTEPPTGLVNGPRLPLANTSNVLGNFIISVPPSLAATFFQQAMQQGVLNFPFQLSATVVT